MLNFSAAKIYLCLEPVDLRKSFDTLAVLVREHLQGDPQSGAWFVFRGKRSDRLKILYWDRNGYALWDGFPSALFQLWKIPRNLSMAQNRIGDLPRRPV